MTDRTKEQDQHGKPRILIVGGVAGGASCATRARRLSEAAEIIIFERGSYASFANCGLPYYVGGVISEEKDLLVATPELFLRRFNIQVRLRNEVVEIDREKREAVVKNLDSGELYREQYDALVLSPGSTPVYPRIPGIDLPGIFTLRTIPDSQQIKKWIAERQVKNVVIIGGGFIGLETVENLVRTGKSVTIIERLSQVMPALDPEIAVRFQERLTANNITLHLGDGVAGFESSPENNCITVKTSSGARYDCDMVLLAIGVRPEASLARQAGLKIGDLGGIRVDEQMRTSDSRIWAVGDAVEVQNFITREWQLVPLAGPASRQGRIAAEVITGRDSRFRGVQGTMVCQVLGMTGAATGLCETACIGKKMPYEKVYVHAGSHAGYYPGAKTIAIKLIFSPGDGKILGAQAIGEDGVEKRIDVISMAMQKGGTVYDLEEAELCYAPQFGSAKDPVNIAGMVAANLLRGDGQVFHWENVDKSIYFFLDVRQPSEFNAGHIEGATNIPLPSLRSRLAELPADREIAVYCSVGQRSYYAARILKQHGFSARNISGGITTYKARKQVKEGLSQQK